MRADRLRLLDAVEQIELISRFSHQGRDAFFSDVLIQSAVLHRLALLGEACRGLSSALREAHPEVPWPQILSLIHIYRVAHVQIHALVADVIHFQHLSLTHLDVYKRQVHEIGRASCRERV